MPDGPRYDDDFYAWTKYQADVLRRLRTDDNQFDRENVVEEIEDLGKNYRDAVRSQVTRILEHFLKLVYSSSPDPRKGWIGSVIEARDALSEQLSPTLRLDVEANLDRLFVKARRRVKNAMDDYREAAAPLPDTCPYSLDEVLRDDWYPEPPEPPK